MSSEPTRCIEDEPYSIDPEERERLTAAPKINEFQRQKLDKDSKKNWDLFYKRNGDRFFKNRFWTRNEFRELYESNSKNLRYLLEVGCGCGDFVLPFLEQNTPDTSRQNPDGLFIYCCDISDQAVKLVQESKLYKENHPKRIKAFVADLTQDNMDLNEELDRKQMDLVSLIFVLSAVDPRNMDRFLANIWKVLKPDGLILFRDYAIYDKAMLRFSDESKICDQFYVRQDGTRAYFFSKEQLGNLFERSGFTLESMEYVRRETLNNATKERYSRKFIQAKIRKRVIHN